MTENSVVLVFSGENGTNVILYDNERHATDRLRVVVRKWMEDDGYDLTVGDFDFDSFDDLTDLCSSLWDMEVVMTTLGRPGNE